MERSRMCRVVLRWVALRGGARWCGGSAAVVQWLGAGYGVMLLAIRVVVEGAVNGLEREVEAPVQWRTLQKRLLESWSPGRWLPARCKCNWATGSKTPIGSQTRSGCAGQVARTCKPGRNDPRLHLALVPREAAYS